MKQRLASILFPDPPRRIPGQRWSNILLRAAHLIGVAGIGGGFLFDLPAALWQNYWQLTLVSGLLLSALYIAASAVWLLQLKGLVIIAKTLLVALALQYPAWQAEIFVLVIALSGVIAHAPAAVRGWRW